MPKCPTCRTEMKPLFYSWYCPKDCDRHIEADADDWEPLIPEVDLFTVDWVDEWEIEEKTPLITELRRVPN